MKQKLIALNLVLAAVAGIGIWQGWKQWHDAAEGRRKVLDARATGSAAPPVQALPVPVAPQAVRYVEVATKDLFSKDRNPTVIIEAPKEEKPKVMPPLPLVYGVLSLPSGVKAMMAEKSGLSSRTVHAGDTVGEFEIAALDSQSVTFTWEGKEIRKKIEDLIDRSNRGDTGGAQGGAATAQPMMAQPASGTNQPAPGSSSAPQVNNPPPSQVGGSPIGVEIGTPDHSERACRPGDSSPAGTVVDGHRKVLTPTPFGTTCRWVPVQ